MLDMNTLMKYFKKTITYLNEIYADNVEAAKEDLRVLEITR